MEEIKGYIDNKMKEFKRKSSIQENGESYFS